MSLEVLLALQEAHAFDPFPVREDLGVYHVPFSQLVGASRTEQSLLEACRRFERVAVVGDSGTGKSSVTASVLGPLTDGVAPVVVPVAVEPSETVSEPRAMFAQIAVVITRYAAEARSLSDEDREEALIRLTAQRAVGRQPGRHVRLGASWMGASISADLARQAGPPGMLARSATETLEVVHQMLATVAAEGLVPVLVFDDTDRWLSDSAYPDYESLVGSFFGRVLPALAELRCALVVAVHRHYLADSAVRHEIERALETRIDIPVLDEAAAIAAVVDSRVQAHADSTLDEVMTDDAVTRLFELYRTGLRGELRGVLRTAHVALADACDIGAAVIGRRLIDAAFAAWDSA